MAKSGAKSLIDPCGAMISKGGATISKGGCDVYSRTPARAAFCRSRRRGPSGMFFSVIGAFSAWGASLLLPYVIAAG
jgi:hypothetical protein